MTSTDPILELSIDPAAYGLDIDVQHVPIGEPRRLPERSEPQPAQLFDLDAERSVLGAMLIRAECIRDAGQLQRSDWWLPKHAPIFRAILQAHAEHGTTDPITVASVLQEVGRLDEVGGIAYLLDLQELATAPAAVAVHADIVRAHAQRRRAIDACADGARRLADGADLDDVVPQLRAVLDPQHGRDDDDLMTLGQLAAVPRRPHVIDNLIVDDSLNELCGPPKQFKTVMADAACVAVADGGEWLGRRVLSPGVVIDYALEGLSGKADRYRAHLGVARFADPNDPIHKRLFLKRSAPNVATVAGQDEMLRTIDKATRIAGMPLRLLKLDTWARAVAGVGLDENKTDEAGSYVAGLDRVRSEFPCAQLIVHHTNKAGEERGSSALTGAADLLMFSGKVGKLEAKVTVRDARDIEVPDPWLVTCCPVVVGQHDDGRPITALRIDTVRPCGPAENEDSTEAGAAEQLRRRVADVVRVQGQGYAESANWITQRIKASRTKALQAVREAVALRELVPDGTGYRIPSVPGRAVPVPVPPYKGGEPRNQEPAGAPDRFREPPGTTWNREPVGNPPARRVAAGGGQ